MVPLYSTQWTCGCNGAVTGTVGKQEAELSNDGKEVGIFGKLMTALALSKPKKSKLLTTGTVAVHKRTSMAVVKNSDK